MMKTRNSKDQEGMPVHRVDRYCNTKTAASIGVCKRRGRTNRSSESCGTPSAGSSKLKSDKLSVSKQVASTDKENEFQNEKLENLCSKLVNLLGQHASQECSSERGTDSRSSPYTGTETERTSVLDSGSELTRSSSAQCEDVQRDLERTPPEVCQNPRETSTVPSLLVPEELATELVEHLIQLKQQLRDLEVMGGKKRSDIYEEFRSKESESKSSDDNLPARELKTQTNHSKSEYLRDQLHTINPKNKTRMLQNRESDSKNILSTDLLKEQIFGGLTEHETFGNKLVSILHMAWQALAKSQDSERKALSSSFLLERMTSAMPRFIHKIESRRFLEKCFSRWRVFTLNKGKRNLSPSLSSAKMVQTARTTGTQDHIQSKGLSFTAHDSDFMDENANMRHRQTRQEPNKKFTCEKGLRSTSRALDVLQASLGQELQDLQTLLSKQVQSLQTQICNKETITGRPPSCRPTWKASLSAIWNVCNDLGEFLLEARSRLRDPDHRSASNNNKKVTQVPIAISFNQKKKESIRQTQGRVDVQKIVNCRAPDKPGIQNSKHSRSPLSNSPKKSIVNPGKKMMLSPAKDPDSQPEVSEKPNCQQRASDKPKPATIKLQLVSNDHRDEIGASCKVTEKQSPYAILELPTNAEITIEASMTCNSNSKLKTTKENKQRMSPRTRSSKFQNCIGAQHAAHLEQEINRLKEQRQVMEEKLEQSLESALVPLQSPAWSWCLETNHV